MAIGSFGLACIVLMIASVNGKLPEWVFYTICTALLIGLI